MFVNDSSRRAWDEGASADAQTRFTAVAAHLEELIGQRRADVNAAMAQYRMTHVADQYHGKEQRWSQAADNVTEIARKLVASLVTTDGHAVQAMSQAGQAVDAIG